jgi:hypothetical protein
MFSYFDINGGFSQKPDFFIRLMEQQISFESELGITPHYFMRNWVLAPFKLGIL